MSAFAAYNVLRNMPIDLTTFNVGNIDSAAMLVYCAGKHRYSLPGPATRFLIHGNSATIPMPMDGAFMDAQLQQLRSLNTMVEKVIGIAAPKRAAEIGAAIQSQRILSPEEAKEWGIVQDIRDSFMEPGAQMLAVEQPDSSPAKPMFTSITPVSQPTHK